MEDADANGRTIVQKDGIWNILVDGVNAGGNVAVSGGDKLYFNQAHTPPVSKDATGVFFGYAFGDSGVQMVASGVHTTVIPVQVGY
jgi:hypothetical protein